MKYKAGDKVKIKANLECNKTYGKFAIIDEMMTQLGKEAVISSILREDAYYIDLDNKCWKWTDEMLEDIVKVKEDIVSELINKWLGRKYEITYVKDGFYTSVMQQEHKTPCTKTVSHTSGNLINMDDDSFKGRLFIENDNGALEIILIESVLEMREIPKVEIQS